MTLLEQAMQPDMIDQSWRKLKTEHTPWTPQVNRKVLEQHLLLHILSLREAVLAGKYRPAPQRRFTMDKSDGGKRVLSAQYLSDKLIQRCLLIVLQPKAEQFFHDDSYAYRPGRGVQMALRKVNERVRCGQDWLVDADIKSFFDTIPHNQLKKKLKAFVKDRPTQRLMELWIAQGTHHSSLLGTSRGISQGAILSPLMCNVYLHSFDQALAKNNIPFVRFADDFLLFSSSKEQATAAQAFAGKILKQLGLQYHPKKTRIVRSSPKVIFLGETLPRLHR